MQAPLKWTVEPPMHINWSFQYKVLMIGHKFLSPALLPLNVISDAPSSGATFPSLTIGYPYASFVIWKKFLSLRHFDPLLFQLQVSELGSSAAHIVWISHTYLSMWPMLTIRDIQNHNARTLKEKERPILCQFQLLQQSPVKLKSQSNASFAHMMKTKEDCFLFSKQAAKALVSITVMQCHKRGYCCILQSCFSLRRPPLVNPGSCHGQFQASANSTAGSSRTGTRLCWSRKAGGISICGPHYSQPPLPRPFPILSILTLFNTYIEYKLTHHYTCSSGSPIFTLTHTLTSCDSQAVRTGAVAYATAKKLFMPV